MLASCLPHSEWRGLTGKALGEYVKPSLTVSDSVTRFWTIEMTASPIAVPISTHGISELLNDRKGNRLPLTRCRIKDPPRQTLRPLSFFCRYSGDVHDPETENKVGAKN